MYSVLVGISSVTILFRCKVSVAVIFVPALLCILLDCCRADSETLYISLGERGYIHSAKGTTELKGSIIAKKPTTVKGTPRESSSFSATPEWL